MSELMLKMNFWDSRNNLIVYMEMKKDAQRMFEDSESYFLALKKYKEFHISEQNALYGKEITTMLRANFK